MKHATPEDTALHQKWEALVRNNQARVVSTESPGFYSPSFLIPKKDGKMRLISDLRRLNKHVFHERMKMPTLKSILDNLQKNHLMATFDIKDGYFNVPIAEESRRFFRFIVGRKCYEMPSLPMGFVCSMRAFVHWLRPYMETLRSLFPEAQFHAYVDDVLIVLPMAFRLKARKLIAQMRQVLQTLGLPIKEAKSNWAPRTRAEHLGFIFDSKKLTIECPPKKSRKIRKQIRQTIKNGRRNKLRARPFATTIGMLMALLPVAKNARLHARALFDAQTKALQQGGWRRNPKVRLSKGVQAELNFWLSFLQNAKGYPLLATYTCHEVTVVATDASERKVAGCLVSDPALPVFTRRLSRAESREHINAKEMMAVVEATKAFPLAGTWVNFRIDNMAVVSALNTWNSRSRALLPMLRTLHSWAMETKTKITSTYINTRSNVLADRLSRDLPIREQDAMEMRLLHRGAVETSKRARWRLHPQALKDLLRAHKARPRALVGELSPEDQVLPQGFTPLRLRKNDRTRTFVFPNVSQVPSALALVETLQLDTIMLVPLWPGASWFHKLALLMAGTPVLLPPLAAKPTNQRRSSCATWSWISVPLSGVKRRRTAFRRLLNCPVESRLSPSPVTATGGGPSHVLSSRTKDYVRRLFDIATKAKH